MRTQVAQAIGEWREHAVELSRERVLRAMAKLACERGYANVSIAALCAEAGVSRSRFYELFDSRQACFLAVLDDGRRHVDELVVGAFERTTDWLEGGRAALAELLLFFDFQPTLARVCLVESLAAGYVSSGYKDAIVYGVLIAYLLVRGGVFLFGRATLAGGASDT